MGQILLDYHFNVAHYLQIVHHTELSYLCFFVLFFLAHATPSFCTGGHKANHLDGGRQSHTMVDTASARCRKYCSMYHH